MATFSKTNTWPVGYFRAYSSWLLRNRKEIAARLSVIGAELDRIGYITVTYRRDEGANAPTEQRTGFSVTPDSSLGCLCQAYIANGGNPLDISSFMKPDCAEVVEKEANGNLKIIYRYPNGGVVAPMSAEPMEPLSNGETSSGFGAYPGGFLNTERYYTARQGRRTSKGSFDFDSIVSSMNQIRSWANQEIKEKLQDIEWRIVKLCDLREQLEKERDMILVQAFGGALNSISSSEFDTNRFDPKIRVQNLIQEMNVLLYDTEPDGTVRSYTANVDVPFLEFTFNDVASEWRDPLGG
jgi:hypothetical protein